MTRHPMITLLLAALFVVGCCPDPVIHDTPVPAIPAPIGIKTTNQKQVSQATPAGSRLDRNALETALFASREQAKIPGLIVAVSTRSDVWIGAAGTRSAFASQSVDGTEQFNIGSVTKTMTATLIMQLAAQGRVKLDDPIESYFPGVPNGTATLRHLATMRSGLPSYDRDEAISHEFESAPSTTRSSEQLLAWCKAVTPVAAPGSMFLYSNTNYVLLGLVIEKVLGKPFAQIVKERLISTLGMKFTRVGTACENQPCLGGAADLTPTGPVPGDVAGWSTSGYGAAGNISSTAADLLLWGRALGTGEGILTPDQQRERLSSIEPLYRGAPLGYGFGIKKHGSWIGHDGLILGYSTWVAYNPTTQTTLVIMANTSIFGTAIAPADYVFLLFRSVLGE